MEVFTEKLSIDQTKDNPIQKFPWIPFGQALLRVLGEMELDGKSWLQNNLPLVLNALGDYPGARKLLEKARHVFYTQLGEQHPYSEIVRNWLSEMDALEKQ